MFIWTNPSLICHLFLFKKKKVLDIIAFPTFGQQKKPGRKVEERFFCRK